MSDRTAPSFDKPELRSAMRAMRRSLTDRADRSARLWDHVRSIDAVGTAGRILLFTSIDGEPETSGFAAWCAAHGAITAVPEDAVEPSWPQVVVVPGLAFTAAGERLGQGGGWYDRYLATVQPGCVTVGVCFEEQLVEALPIEPHDVRVDHVVTDRGVVR